MEQMLEGLSHARANSVRKTGSKNGFAMILPRADFSSGVVNHPDRHVTYSLAPGCGTGGLLRCTATG
jgi:hypothetical protein